MQPVTSTAVPRTITQCNCFAVGFVLGGIVNIAFVIIMTMVTIDEDIFTSQ